MLLKWFSTRKAVETGAALADQLALAQSTSSPGSSRKSGRPGKQLHAFLEQIDREARPLQLNLFGRARLANSYQWRLLEKGVAPETVDELTEMLLLRLSSDRSAAAAATAPAPQLASLEAPGPDRAKLRKTEALLAEADSSLDRGAYAEAAAAYAQALELNPRHAVAHNNLGAALSRLGRYHEAREHFRRAVELDPRRADAHSNLGSALLWTGHISEAEAPLRRALKLSPRHVDAQVALGRTHYALGRLRDAKDAYEKALKAAPANVYALTGLGQIAATEGRFGEAETLFKRATQREPKAAPGAWAGLAALRRMTPADAGWLETAENIASSNLAPLDEAPIRFAIGKYNDDIGDFTRAFASYKRANELLKTGASRYDREDRSSFVDDMIRLYTHETLSHEHPGSSSSTRPVFVTGMMRSGTSLIEQIIASHPSAMGAGELDFWNDAVRKRQPDVRHELLSEQTRKQLSSAYLQTLARHSADALRVVDKSTFNSDYLGIIHTVFPQARMIYVQRDPIDTCLSCYFQQFSTALSFTMDLSDLAFYYREHRRLISHWRAVLPSGTLLEVPYEELVADQEKWTRKIIDFLGLEWDPRCLEFEKTDRTVLTASQWQVRQKIFKTSVARWRNYRKFIEPLLGLKDLQT
jgi:tetratricopeptide (TPR) repeat protein